MIDIKKITLSTKKELNIYMSPMRQKLLRQLSISCTSMTPKMLADKLGISSSGVQHHIKKLVSLGLVELDHTKTINGIIAHYYRPTHVTVQVGLNQSDDLSPQREAILQDSISNVYDGFQKHMSARKVLSEGKEIDAPQKLGDVLTGVMYLNQKESDKLMSIITTFIENHSVATENCTPWEYAIIAYNAQEVNYD